MYALTLPYFGVNLDTTVPKFDKSTNPLLTLVLGNPISKYLYYKRTRFILNNIFKKIDSAVVEISSKKELIAKPEDAKVQIKTMIQEFNDLREQITEINYYTSSQEKELKTIATNIIKKMLRLETIAIKQSNKNKPKLDDSGLINLVMNNNSIELGKTILSK